MSGPAFSAFVLELEFFRVMLLQRGEGSRRPFQRVVSEAFAGLTLAAGSAVFLRSVGAVGAVRLDAVSEQFRFLFSEQ